MQIYEEFIKKQELCDFQQSTKWSRVKELWQNDIIIVRDESRNILASMSILVRKLPILGYIMYVPRGPIGNIHNEEVLKKLTEEAKRIQKTYNAFAIIIEPNVRIENKEFAKMVTRLGYKINSKAIKFDQEIQARHNFRLNIKDKTEEEVFNNFSSKTRYNVRLAIKRGVKIKEKNLDAIDEFYSLMKETGNRDNFIIRPKEYFEKILEEFPNEAKIYIAYYENEPISAIMPILYGNKMWYLYGASSNKHRNLMSTYLLQWEMIKIAIKHGCNEYDFRGVSMENGEDGLYRFKKGFGGELVELIGEIYMDFKPVKYLLYKVMKKVFFNLRYIVYKITRKNYLMFDFKNGKYLFLLKIYKICIFCCII